MNEATQTANTIIQEKEAADLGQMLKHIPEAERVALLYTAKILAAIATTPAASRAS